MTKKKVAFQQLFSQPSPPPPSQLQVSNLQTQFLHTLQSVMEAFEQLPDSVSHLKQFFSQLVLPMGEGKVVPLVSPSTYENAATTKEVFRSQSSLWNCFSPHLLQMMSEECQCPPAIAAVEQFMQFRSKFATSLVCRRTKKLTVQQPLSIPATWPTTLVHSLTCSPFIPVLLNAWWSIVVHNLWRQSE